MVKILSVCYLPNYPHYSFLVSFSCELSLFSAFLFPCLLYILNNRKLHSPSNQKSSSSSFPRLLSRNPREPEHRGLPFHPPIPLQSIAHSCPRSRAAESGSAASPDPDKPGFARPMVPVSGRIWVSLALLLRFFSCPDSVLICCVPCSFLWLTKISSWSFLAVGPLSLLLYLRV